MQQPLSFYRCSESIPPEVLPVSVESFDLAGPPPERRPHVKSRYHERVAVPRYACLIMVASMEYRRIVSGKYVCVYKVIDQAIVIYRIVNGATDYPKYFYPSE